MLLKMTSHRFLAFFIGILALFANHSTTFAVWQSPPTSFSDVSAISSDAGGNAIAMVSTFDGVQSTISAYNYINGAWLLTGQFDGGTSAVFSLEIAMDPSGTALAVWTNVSDVGNTAYFNGTAWFTPLNNPLASNSSSPQVAMNELGQGVMVWLDSGFNVMSSFFSNQSLLWSNPVDIGDGFFIKAVKYSMNGTAVAMWDNSNITVSNFIGGSWSMLEIDPDPASNTGDIGIDANGQALALWNTANGDIVVSFLMDSLGSCLLKFLLLAPDFLLQAFQWLHEVLQ